MKMSISRPVTTILGSDLEVEGNIASDGEIVFHGTLRGSLTAHKLTLARDAVVEGRIEAESVIINGAFSGTLSSTSVLLGRTASVNADVTCVSMAIEVGAVYSGRAHHVDRLEPRAELGAIRHELANEVAMAAGGEKRRSGGSSQQLADRDRDAAMVFPVGKC